MLVAKYFKKYQKPMRFAIVGIGNLMISLITYYTLVYNNVNYQVANVVGFIISSLHGYYWNQRWVFGVGKMSLKSLFKFYMTYLTTYLIGAVLLFLEVDVMGFSRYTVPLINVVVTTPINYIMNRCWTFKKQCIKGGRLKSKV